MPGYEGTCCSSLFTGSAVGKKHENKRASEASRAWTGKEDGAAEPVDKGFMPPFQATRRALDPSAISYWPDH